MPLSDPAVAELAPAAADAGVAACFGLAERAAGGAAHITQVVAAAGRVAGLQRKRHLGEGEEAFTPADRPPGRGAGPRRRAVRHRHLRGGAATTRPSTRPRRQAPAWCCSRPRPGCTGGGPSAASWRDGFAWWEGSGLGDARRHARRRGLWIALAGQAGSTADEDFPGLAALVSPAGTVTGAAARLAGRARWWRTFRSGRDAARDPLSRDPVPRPAGPGRMDRMAYADGRPGEGGGLAAPPADLIVIAAAVIEQGRLLVVSTKSAPDIFCLPGGTPGPGETARETLIRELGEELGAWRPA